MCLSTLPVQYVSSVLIEPQFVLVFERCFVVDTSDLQRQSNRNVLVFWCVGLVFVQASVDAGRRMVLRIRWFGSVDLDFLPTVCRYKNPWSKPRGIIHGTVFM